MADFKQVYSAANSLTITGFSTLAAAGTATSNEVDNGTTDKYDEIIIEVKATYSETNQAGAWLDLRVLASIDGSDTDYSTVQNPYLVLPPMDMSAAGGSTTAVYHARFVPPKFWKIYVKSNITTNALDAGTISWIGVYYTGV